jgi:glutaredoxin-like YruB-family protein
MSKEVKVFSTPTCPYCDQLKNYLTEKNVKYTEINLAEKPEEAEKLVKKTGQMGVPATIITNGDDEQAIVGFDVDKINQALGL